MAKKIAIHKGKKTGLLAHALTVPCLLVEQSGYELFVFKMKASLAWKIFSISRKEPDANKGYQRFLSEARVDAYCDSWVMYKLSKALHEEIYKSFTDSIGVFSYIESRTEISGLSTLN